MFQIELQVNGVMRQRINNVPAYNHDGMLRIPNYAEFADKLPERVAQAVQRGEWSVVYSDLLSIHLTTRDGKPMGLLLARWFKGETFG